MLVIISAFILLIKKKNIFMKNKYKKIIITLICLIATFSLSISNTGDVVSFLIRYQQVILGICAFFLFIFLNKKHKEIVLLFVITAFINNVFKIFILIKSSFFLEVIGKFLYAKQYILLIKNINRDRIYLDLYDEALIPFFFLFKPKSKKMIVVKYFVIITTIFLSFFSQVRSTILVLLISFLLSIFFIKRKLCKAEFFWYLFSFSLAPLLANYFMRRIIGFSFLDRFLLNPEFETTTPIKTRFEQILISVKIANSYFFGAGLGNFYNLLENNFKIKNFFEFSSDGFASGTEYPHNIFALILAESGYVSFFIFISLLIVFFKNDIKNFSFYKSYQQAAIISFWSLFIFSLFNPATNALFNLLFFGMRGLLIKNNRY
jgi:hypothetical protein